MCSVEVLFRKTIRGGQRGRDRSVARLEGEVEEDGFGACRHKERATPTSSGPPRVVGLMSGRFSSRYT